MHTMWWEIMKSGAFTERGSRQSQRVSKDMYVKKQVVCRWYIQLRPSLWWHIVRNSKLGRTTSGRLQILK